MTTAKIFDSKHGQAVRLPKQFRVQGKELEILRRGNEILLREKQGAMLRAFELLASLPQDLAIAGRKNDRPQERGTPRPRKRRRS